MSRTILRGRALSFVSEPQGMDDAGSYRYWEDGAITIEAKSNLTLSGALVRIN